MTSQEPCAPAANPSVLNAQGQIGREFIAAILTQDALQRRRFSQEMEAKKAAVAAKAMRQPSGLDPREVPAKPRFSSSSAPPGSPPPATAVEKPGKAECDDDDTTPATGEGVVDCATVNDFPLVGLNTVARLRAQFATLPLHSRFNTHELLVVHPEAAHYRAPDTSWYADAQPAPLSRVRTFLGESWLYFEALAAIAQAEKEQSDCELVVAGSAVAAALYNGSFCPGDLDLFFVSPSMDDSAATEFFLKLLDVFDAAHAEYPITVVRNENCTSVAVADWDNGKVEKYQFIHRLYPSAASIVGGFDLGCCAAMLHDGFGRISLTHLGAWSLALDAIIVDVTRRSKSFEHRLYKYSKRGLSVIFPGVKSDLVNTSVELAQFDAISISLLKRRARANNNTPSSATSPTPELMLTLPKGETSDYGPYEIMESFEHPQIYLEHQNYSLAVQNRPEAIMAYCRGAEDLLTSGKLSMRDIVMRNCLVPIGRVAKIAKESVLARDRYESRPRFHGRNQRPTDLLTFRFGEAAADYAISEISGDLQRCHQIEEETIERVINILSQRNDALRGRIGWRKDNPGSQWTGSFNPLGADPREFYTAELYESFHVMVTDSVYTIVKLLARENNLFARLPREVLRLVAEQIMLGEYNDLFFAGSEGGVGEAEESFHYCQNCNTYHHQVSEARQLREPMIFPIPLHLAGFAQLFFTSGLAAAEFAADVLPDSDSD